MKFETQFDRDREIKAITAYTKVKGGKFKKLGEHDIDFQILNDSNDIEAYVEVKGRNRLMHSAFPLPISLFKLSKLENKHIKAIVIWSCKDGMYFANIEDIIGEVRFGGRTPREGASHDEQLMVYYDKQKGFEYINFVD